MITAFSHHMSRFLQSAEPVSCLAAELIQRPTTFPPDEDGEMNNLQLAFARINRGLHYARRPCGISAAAALRNRRRVKKAMMKLVAKTRRHSQLHQQPHRHGVK
uniref:Uncharacterized protein n=1 Tax=Sphaerodactylus townsendi TaxID=933632 RepID=A0ACB8FVR2_9SAUR